MGNNTNREKYGLLETIDSKKIYNLKNKYSQRKLF